MGKNFKEKKLEKHKITIFKKNNRRIIKNFDEMVENLKKFFSPEIEISVIEPEKYSVTEQIEILLNSNFFIYFF